MKISGDLEDARIAEVMQVIHLGGRSGTLQVESDGRRAEIGFLRGRMVRASATGGPRLGDVVVARGVVSGGGLEQAVAGDGEGAPRPLGRTLLDAGLLSGPELRAAVEEQIQATVFEVVGWRRGSFAFDVDQLLAVEETARYPGELVPEMHFDTQKLLLEAYRRLEDKGHGGGESPQRPDPTRLKVEPWPPGAAGPASPPAADADAESTVAPLPRIHLVTTDRVLAAGLARSVRDEPLHLVGLALRHAGTGLPGERQPLVVVDLRRSLISSDDVRSLKRRHPKVQVVAIVETPEMSAGAYDAGAVAVVPPEPEVVAACLRRHATTPLTLEVTSSDRGDIAVGRVRRVLADLRSGLFSATVSLSLMNIVSESAERALLFLVRRHDLSVLGAFGFAPPEGRPLAEATRGLHIPLAAGGALRLAITEGRLRTVPFAEEHLPAELMRRIGCPRYRHGTIVPVLGKEEVVVVIYADNGAIDAPVADLDLLEVAAAQVGFAFENELLRRAATRVGRNEPSREAEW